MTSSWYLKLIMSPGTRLIDGNTSSGTRTETVTLVSRVIGSIRRGATTWDKSLRNVDGFDIDERANRRIGVRIAGEAAREGGVAR